MKEDHRDVMFRPELATATVDTQECVGPGPELCGELLHHHQSICPRQFRLCLPKCQFESTFKLMKQWTEKSVVMQFFMLNFKIGNFVLDVTSLTCDNSVMMGPSCHTASD